MRGPFTTAIGLGLVLVCVASAGAAAPPAKPGFDDKRSCNSINLGEPRVFYKHNMRCSTAKHYARRLFTTDGGDWPRNFTCESGSNFNEGGSCRHDSKDKYFGWHPAD